MISDQELSLIRDNLPSDCRYFIAGGCLLPGYHNDIDIYFYSEADYTLASSYFINSLSTQCEYTSNNADTYNIFDTPGITITVQFVHRLFGTPFEILSDFDLNKSRQALLLDNTIYQHPTFDLSLRFELNNFRYNTLERFAKYAYDKHQPIDIKYFQYQIRQLLSQPLDTPLGHYYLIDETGDWTIGSMLNKFIHHNFVMLSYLLPIFESFPAEKRYEIYSTIINSHTFIIPVEHMSAEFNTFTYLCRFPNSAVFMPPAELFSNAIDTYPELFI